MANSGVERPPLAKHDSTTLDLVFTMDCTGSMGSYIHTATENIRKISEDIVSSEKCDIRLALIEYRDHPPQDSTFVTRVHDFTGSVGTMKKWLDGCSAAGGGDTPEAVADALHQVLKLSWRENATKICVFIADAPPHGLSSSGDTFPNGCPDGLDPLVVTKDIASKGITLYMVGCEPSITPYKDFMMTLSFLTGGQYIPLSAAKLLTQVIIGGAQEEISLEKFMEEVNQQVDEEVKASGGVFDDDAIASKVSVAMKSRNVRTKQLNMNKSSVPAASPQARVYSKMDSMSAVKNAYEKSPASTTAHGGMHAHMSSRRALAGPPSGSRGRGGYGGIPPPPPPSPLASGYGPPPAGAGPPPPPPPPGGSPAYACDILSASPAAPTITREATDLYEVAEDDVSDEQVMRMVQKSKARKGY